MRVAVTGQAGQLVLSMMERTPQGVSVIPLGRPDLDLGIPSTIGPALESARPDIIVNAAAYTAVDQAESEPELAERINGTAAGLVAATAARLCVPVIHISTDYVFSGMLLRPYREDDATGPISAYGRSKLAGEQAVAASTPDHAILRTAWVYSPFGKNFVKTMLRLGESRSEVSVVADQSGSPTSALDLADAIFAVARNLLSRPLDDGSRGIFHMAAEGTAVWADVAEEIFASAAKAGRPHVSVRRISTADYPTPARRPANSRLDGAKLALVHGVKLPEWHGALDLCVGRFLNNG